MVVFIALPQLTDLTPSTLTHVVGDNTTIRCTGQGDPPPSVIFHGIECTKYSGSEGKGILKVKIDMVE